MKKSYILSAILILSGLVALFVGVSVIFIPAEFYAPYGIEVLGNLNLLSELKSAGGAILFSGAFILVGAFVPRITKTATNLSILIFLVFGLSRLVSIVQDGLPAQEMILVMAIELFLGVVSLVARILYRKKND